MRSQASTIPQAGTLWVPPQGHQPPQKGEGRPHRALGGGQQRQALAAPFPQGAPCPTGDSGAEREGGLSPRQVLLRCGCPYPTEQGTEKGPCPTAMLREGPFPSE